MTLRAAGCIDERSSPDAPKVGDMPSSDAQALSEWVTAVARELGLEGTLDSLGVVDLVLDMTSDVAHDVSRPGDLCASGPDGKGQARFDWSFAGSPRSSSAFQPSASLLILPA